MENGTLKRTSTAPCDLNTVSALALLSASVAVLEEEVLHQTNAGANVPDAAAKLDGLIDRLIADVDRRSDRLSCCAQPALAWVVRVVCDQNGTLGVAHAASAAAGCVSSPLLTAQLLRRVTNALTEGFSLGLQTVHVQLVLDTAAVKQGAGSELRRQLGILLSMQTAARAAAKEADTEECMSRLYQLSTRLAALAHQHLSKEQANAMSHSRDTALTEPTAGLSQALSNIDQALDQHAAAVAHQLQGTADGTEGALQHSASARDLREELRQLAGVAASGTVDDLVSEPVVPRLADIIAAANSTGGTNEDGSTSGDSACGRGRQRAMMAARALDDIFGSAHDPKRAMVLRCCNAQDCSDIGANPSDIGKFGLHLWKSGATRHLVGALAPRMPDRVLCAVLKALYSSIRLSWAAERFARGSEQSRNDFYDADGPAKLWAVLIAAGGEAQRQALTVLGAVADVAGAPRMEDWLDDSDNLRVVQGLSRGGVTEAGDLMRRINAHK